MLLRWNMPDDLITQSEGMVGLVLHRQFSAAIGMFDNAMQSVPDLLWQTPMWSTEGRDSVFSQPWYIAYHTLFFTDMYLGTSDVGFMPPPPYNLDELNPAGVPPAKVLMKQDLAGYSTYIKGKAAIRLLELDLKTAAMVCHFSWGFQISAFDLIIDNIRHIQEHQAQLSMFIGQQQAYNQTWLTE